MRITIKFALPVLIAVLVVAYYASASEASTGQRTVATNNYLIQLGPVEVIRGPDSLSDNPFHTSDTGSELSGYIANGHTVRYSGGSLETLRQVDPWVISEGTDFDLCGAWLNSTWHNGGKVLGWYHAETACNYPATHKSVAFAESQDGGHTFSKPSYPYNQVITAPSRLTNPDDDDEGDQRVIRVGDYFYMYFVASRDWQIRLARASVTSGGVPGTWYKYYNNSFSQPGLGGESTPIDPTGALTRSWVSYASTLGKFIGYSYVQRDYSVRADKFAGYGFTLSPDGIQNWVSLPYVILPSEGEYWGRNATSLELVEYPSMIGLYGESEQINESFWLYYMVLNAGEDFDKRYLVRRKVRVLPTTATAAIDLVPRIALSEYTQADDIWYTTRHASGYQFQRTIGYLFTDQIPNSIPVYDCFIPFWNDHMLVPNDATCDDNGVQPLGRAGWISTVPFANSIPVYRCWDAQATNHFLSVDQACNGKAMEWRLGYLADAPQFPSPDFVALSRYEDPVEQDTWVTNSLPPENYTFKTRLGYLFTAAHPNTFAVYDCYLPNEHDHMLDIDVKCGNPAVQNLGLMGWIKTEPFEGSVPIYRCHDPVVYNHFVSTDPACEGKTIEWRIGYLSSRPVNLYHYAYLPCVKK